MLQADGAVVLEPAGVADASVIWLHGLGADGHDFVPVVPELQLNTGHCIRFVFPHAPVRPITINGGMAMRGWYDVVGSDLTVREDESGIRQSATIVAQLVGAERSKGVRSDRIVLAGFSQGGAIALFAGLRYPDALAGIVALSTYLPLPGTLAEASPANAAVPIFMGHGSHDPLIPVHQGQRSAQLLATRGYNVEWKTYPMPHSVCPQEISDIAKFLARTLPPL